MLNHNASANGLFTHAFDELSVLPFDLISSYTFSPVLPGQALPICLKIMRLLSCGQQQVSTCPLAPETKISVHPFQVSSSPDMTYQMSARRPFCHICPSHVCDQARVTVKLSMLGSGMWRSPERNHETKTTS